MRFDRLIFLLSIPQNSLILAFPNHFSGMKHIGIVGMGLIGGSIGLQLRSTGRYRVYGSDTNPLHEQAALERGLMDERLTGENIPRMNGIIISVPVDALPRTTAYYLDRIHPDAWLTDTGSIKFPLARHLAAHPRRRQLVLAHPIAGTEYSGPQAAVPGLFRGKINILCDTAQSAPAALNAVKELFGQDLEMDLYEMDAATHDRHIAYVSHLSHVSAFMLGKTVMDNEPDEKNIFLMAGSGFASTVRLAKSSPATWTPIFTGNREHLLPVLRAYMKNLELFIDLLEQNNEQKIRDLLTEINYIGQVIDRIQGKHGKQ